MQQQNSERRAARDKKPCPWKTGQGCEALTDRRVHVWRADLESAAQHLRQLAPLLDEDEKARAAKFHLDKHRLPYVLSHAILRDVLARYLGAQPAALRFGSGPHGKPELSRANASPDLIFNMTHSETLALYAVALAADVGIDVEFLRGDMEFDSISERFFSEREAVEIRDTRGSDKTTRFFNCWTRKEAYIKALGVGVSLPLDSFSVSTAPLRHGEAVTLCPPPGDTRVWRIVNLDAGVGYAAALAFEGHGAELDFTEWTLPPGQ